MRDLKPSNVGFNKDGNVRLFDFGMARYLRDGDMPTSGDQAGTYRYMAPEVMVANGWEVALPSDVYSFGVMLWELCTLHRPFESLTIRKRLTIPLLVHKVAREEWRPSLRRIHSRRVQSLIDACWAANPSVRPTFDDICVELSTLIKHEDHKM